MVSLGKPAVAGQVYPNPAVSEVFVKYVSASSGPLTLRVMNQGGQVMMEKEVKAVDGMNRFRLDGLEAWRPGIYLIEMISGNARLMSEKLIRK
jgi:hypothetical protein